jgi:universal stress protein E
MSVAVDCRFRSPLHQGVIEKAQACHADLVIKDTHFHGPIRRALFTNTDWHLIRELPVPLMLTKSAAWHAGLRVAAALDPGHRDDRLATLDRQLVDVAAGIAAAMQGEVLAVHAFNPVPLFAGMAATVSGHAMAPILDAGLMETVRQLHWRELKALLAGYSALEGREALLEGAPEVVLPEFVVRKEIDLLVTGAVSRSPLRRWVVGSTAERLLDRLACDILVVKPEGFTSSGASFVAA